ncbi:hypothetical protein [Caballeronia hypogeia]|uniref:hypothetical protein n=1 Tax=Caballeronia hypogeia TaxID=1777140 RepID=UPI0018DF70B3|nr:hypothetical protein [Caballeronia hypogeia]
MTFFRASSLILLSASILVVVSIALLGLSGIVTAPEFRDISLAIVPGMAGYIPAAIAFIMGEAKPKGPIIWRPFAYIIFAGYLVYFSILEATVILYAFRPIFDIDAAKFILGGLQSVFGFAIGGIFVKKLLK